jgi:hypothetical protein
MAKIISFPLRGKAAAEQAEFAAHLKALRRCAYREAIRSLTTNNADLVANRTNEELKLFAWECAALSLELAARSMRKVHARRLGCSKSAPRS